MSLHRYRDLLRQPSVLRLVTYALVARIPVASQSLALLLLVHSATGSYAAAGAVTAANGCCVGLFAPLQGRLIDIVGQTRVLVPCVLGNVLALCGLTVFTLAGAHTTLLVACA